MVVLEAIVPLKIVTCWFQGRPMAIYSTQVIQEVGEVSFCPIAANHQQGEGSSIYKL